MANSNVISEVAPPSVALTRRSPPVAIDDRGLPLGGSAAEGRRGSIDRHPLVAVGLGILVGYLIARLAGR
jgi:hypothetical protein